MSYAVVKNLENAYYVVPKKWLTLIGDDDKQYTFYPPTKLKKCVENMKDIQDNWLTEEVKIILNNCSDLKEAREFIDLKCSFSNTEASELDKKKKMSKKRKRENPAQIDGENFNKMFDEEATSSQKNMDLENTMEDQTVPTNESLSYSSPEESFHRSLSMQSNDNNQNNSMLSQNVSFPMTSQRFADPLFHSRTQISKAPSTSVRSVNSSSHVVNNTDFNSLLHQNMNLPSTSRSSANTMPYVGTVGNTIMIRRDVIEQLVEEMNALKVNQQIIIEAVNNINITLRNEFTAIKGMINSQRNCELDIIYKPQMISSVEQLDEMENKLELMQESFVDEYKKMHNYYASSVTLPNKGFGVQNGYIHSLMSMYLDKEFAKSFAWASTKQKSGFDIYKNHIKFFKSVCNKVEIGAGQPMFKNLTEVENSIQKYFKSIHQKPRAIKLNSQITSAEKNDENFDELM